MTSITCEGVLFDLDGVLVDSTPAVARVWTKWALKHGFVPDDVVRQAHGRPSIATIRELLPHADHAAENVEMEHQEIEDLDGWGPTAGSAATSASFASGPLDHRHVVYPAARRGAHRRRGTSDAETIGHFDDVLKGKPDPEPYVKGAARLGFAAARRAVVNTPASCAGKPGNSVLALRTTAPTRENGRRRARMDRYRWLFPATGNPSDTVNSAWC